MPGTINLQCLLYCRFDGEYRARDRQGRDSKYCLTEGHREKKRGFDTETMTKNANLEHKPDVFL